jgi:very-short-patch-repair endonuclease
MKPSPLETTFALAISSYDIPQPERNFKFLPERKLELDFAWVDLKIAVEVQGSTWRKGGHNTGAGLKRDYEKLNLAQMCGWVVLQYGTDEVNSGQAAKETAAFVEERCKTTNEN